MDKIGKYVVYAILGLITGIIIQIGYLGYYSNTVHPSVDSAQGDLYLSISFLYATPFNVIGGMVLGGISKRKLGAVIGGVLAAIIMIILYNLNQPQYGIGF